MSTTPTNVISNFFSRKELFNILEYGNSELYNQIVDMYIEIPEKKTNREIIQEIYHHLEKNRRNEYFYINTFFNKFFFRRHTNDTALFQLRIGDSIADFVTIDVEGKVFEVKSDLDNLERLNSQILEYYKVFSKVSVFVPSHQFNTVKNRLDKLGDAGRYVGIYVLSNRTTISRVDKRLPQNFCKFLDHYTMFAMLRKAEYQSIILKKYGVLPSVTNVFFLKNVLKNLKKSLYLKHKN